MVNNLLKVSGRADDLPAEHGAALVYRAEPGKPAYHRLRLSEQRFFDSVAVLQWPGAL
jgi:hypothetical protein